MGFQDQMRGMGLYAKDAYKSGERNKKERDAQRKNIYATISRYEDSLLEEDKNSTISAEIDKSFAYFDNYLHNYCNPKEVPDFFSEYMHMLMGLIKSTDKYARSLDNPDTDIFEDFGFMETIAVLVDEWNKVAAKVLKIAYELRDPPTILPDVNKMYPPPKDTANGFKM